MSINSMANAAAARRPDTAPIGQVPTSLDEIAKASTTPPSVTPPGPAPAGTPETTQSSVDTALNVLFGYIPTEVITLYVAVLAAVQHTTAVSTTEWTTEWTTFCIFLVATPVVVWLVYGAKLLHVKKTLPVSFGSIPIWEMVAATCAFAAWAFALPNSPFASFPSWYSPGLSGVAVLVVSTVLGLLAPFFQRPLTA